MEENNNDVTKTQNQETNQDGQQAISGTALEAFLADPEHRGVYDAAVTAAVEQALAERKAEEEEKKRVAALSDQEKADEREKALAEREARLQAAELKSAAITKLAAGGMSPDLAECLNYTSKEAYEQSYLAATAAFEKAVQAAVNDRLRSKTPPVVQQSSMTGRTTGSFASIINENKARR